MDGKCRGNVVLNGLSVSIVQKPYFILLSFEKNHVTKRITYKSQMGMKLELNKIQVKL